MGPELQPFQDKCFISLLDLDIASVLQCHVTSCCSKFIHKYCLRKARETSFQCGHCRLMPNKDSNSIESVHDELRANETLDDSDKNPVWNTSPGLQGPTLIETARTAITDLRGSTTDHNLLQHDTQSWEHLPHPIDVMVWYMMWVNLIWFISANPDGPRSLFVHTTHQTSAVRQENSLPTHQSNDPQ